MIAQETIERVREQTNLAELIGESVKLERRGRSYVGLCPFHQERTPSFHVNDERGFYHCFGCKAAGDAFKFVQETEGLEFIEAVRRLAERLGIAAEAVGPCACFGSDGAGPLLGDDGFDPPMPHRLHLRGDALDPRRRLRR